jgi:hypothetical protein
MPYTIKISWDGPHKIAAVIEKMKNGGKSPDWNGDDYGVYQIYGKHIIYGRNTLLYIGKATNQTFSTRIKQHKRWWLDKEENIEIYLGRIYNRRRHSPKDKWNSWMKDVKTTEEILLYKYSPNYNSTNIESPPKTNPKKIILIHIRKKNRLKARDYAPEDFE